MKLDSRDKDPVLSLTVLEAGVLISKLSAAIQATITPVQGRARFTTDQSMPFKNRQAVGGTEWLHIRLITKKE